MHSFHRILKCEEHISLLDCILFFFDTFPIVCYFTSELGKFKIFVKSAFPSIMSLMHWPSKRIYVCLRIFLYWNFDNCTHFGEFIPVLHSYRLFKVETSVQLSNIIFSLHIATLLFILFLLMVSVKMYRWDGVLLVITAVGWDMIRDLLMERLVRAAMMMWRLRAFQYLPKCEKTVIWKYKFGVVLNTEKER